MIQPVDLTQRLRDRVAVITGAMGAIGMASVRRLSAEGARVVLTDLHDENAGRELAQEVDGLYVRADVTDSGQVAAVFDVALREFGSVDIAFHNAGIAPREDASILDTELETWRRVNDVNLTSVYHCCKAVLPIMVEQGRGSIINTASFVATMGAATSQIAYSASKGGVLSMTREIGVQYARKGIRANALCPGPVHTPLLAHLFADDPEQAQRRLVHCPMGRFGLAEEQAAAVAFLASDDSSFITATAFLVDGGISAAYVTPLDGE